jgi:hypothetical protein
MTELNLPEPYGYENTYIHLMVPMPEGLPSSIVIKGHKLLLKSEFHISLIKTAFAAELIDKTRMEEIQDEIYTLFIDFISKQPLNTFYSDNQFRFVELDIRKTLVGLVNVPHLTEFFDELRAKFGVDIPNQPTHITMYTLQPEKGIGILSEQQLEEASQSVEVPELAALKLAPVAK